MGQRALLLSTALLVCSPTGSAAYSVLAHEALIDDAWKAQIAPMLLQKFPRTSEHELQEARAYAYGGSLIQDLGYYPFGSRFFSNLVHYVRSGDFVSALIRESHNVDEYAFALGALAHYASDTAAHPTVNHVVPMIYPELHAKFGDEVLFGESKARHVMVEFTFDVLQVARGRFNSDAYQDFIGFEVARPLLERVFAETYGLELKDVFGDVGLAIGTYRRATSEIIPDVTRAAWREKRDEILAANPDVTERDFVYAMTRQEYEKAYGTTYRKPGLLVRFFVAVFKVLPKFGPFRPLAFEPLTAETGRMFLESFDASRDRYRTLLLASRKETPMLAELDLDTGRRPRHGVNEIADETYGDLLAKLRRKRFAGVSPGLRHALAEHYAAPSPREAVQ
jgi:hypothetical protein